MESTAYHGSDWIPRNFHGFRWIHRFRETPQTWNPANSMKFHGILGVPRMLLNPSNPTEPRFSKSHGFHKGLRNPWNYGNVEIRGFHGSLESYGIPWNSSQHGNSKKLLEFYGIPTHRNHRMLEICEFHKKHWIPFTLGFHGSMDSTEFHDIHWFQGDPWNPWNDRESMRVLAIPRWRSISFMKFCGFHGSPRTSWNSADFYWLYGNHRIVFLWNLFESSDFYGLLHNFMHFHKFHGIHWNLMDAMDSLGFHGICIDSIEFHKLIRSYSIAINPIDFSWIPLISITSINL